MHRSLFDLLNRFLAHWYLIIRSEKFTSNDVVLVRKIFDLLNIFLDKEFLILNYLYILIDYF